MQLRDSSFATESSQADSAIAFNAAVPVARKVSEDSNCPLRNRMAANYPFLVHFCGILAKSEQALKLIYVYGMFFALP
eukprot:scaffold7295_cov167-Amphora_coffeaeformis.AAC.10